MPTSSDGEIFTFYSYKGGTGRSLMLANVAWILASNGKRVLTIDWDLEAPGLHRYFEPFLPENELANVDGVIDLMIDFTAEAATPAEGDAADDWFLPYADIRRCATALDWDFGDNGTLHLVSAGRQGASYATRVNSFDWDRFYNVFRGGAFLEAMKNQVKSHYDYVLIDSRTGVSDTSGICTVQLPDALCFTLNNQGIEGASAVARSVLAQRRSTIRVLPVPMRVENSEKDKVDQRRRYARHQFRGLPADSLVSDAEAYWADVELLYVPFYAYDEILATIADEPDQRHSVLEAAESLTRYLTGGRVDRLRPVTPEEKAFVKGQYARRGQAALSERYDVFLSCAAADAASAERIANYLRSRGLRPLLGRSATPGKLWREEFGEVLQTVQSCAVLVGGDQLDGQQQEELAVAAQRADDGSGFRVFAVLLPGLPSTFDPSELPPELRTRTWVDLRAGVDTPKALRPLLQAMISLLAEQAQGTDGVGVPTGTRIAPDDVRRTERRMDLLLEAGGVKGIALVGALSVLDEHGYEPQYLAGASAGAVLAALIAAGYTIDELRQITFSLDFRQFLDKSGGWESKIPILGSRVSLLLDQGLYEGGRLLEWLRELLAQKGVRTFADLRSDSDDPRYAHRVQLIVSDITGRRLLILPRDAAVLGIAPDELEVALAVRASMSIPIFFEPVRIASKREDREHVLVDGGILSNFPVWLFDVEEEPLWPTFGIRTVEPDPRIPLQARLPKPERTRGRSERWADYLSVLVHALVEGQDRRFIEQAEYARTIAVPSLGVGTTEFDLSAERKQALYSAGRGAAADFLKSWDLSTYIEASSRRRRVGRPPIDVSGVRSLGMVAP